jgi:hypothetical protein
MGGFAKELRAGRCLKFGLFIMLNEILEEKK